MKKIVYFLLVAMGQLTYTMENKSTFEKVLGTINQSSVVYFIEKNWNVPVVQKTRELIQAFNHGTDLAAPQFQEIGKKAQQDLGIKSERHVPIKKMVPTSLAYQLAAAIAEPDAIFLNEEKLQTRSFGAQRSAIYHEAVHRKYMDETNKEIISWGSLIGSGLLAHKTIKSIKSPGKFKILHGVGVATAGLFASSTMSIQYGHYCEKRADTEGHYATNCFKCVGEHVDVRNQLFNEKHVLRDNGYLSGDKLALIVHDLKQQNAVCESHKK